MTFRAHPITIVVNLRRFLYLIIISVIRGLLAAFQGGLTGWLRGAWVDVLVVLVMVGLSVLQWRALVYRYEGEHLEIDSGALVRKRVLVPLGSIVTLSAIHSFYLRPFRAVRLRMDTLGGGSREADFIVLVHRDTAERAMALHAGEEQAMVRRYTPRTTSVLALAFLTSNSLAGIVFIATLISQSGKLVGAEFSQQLVDTWETTARTLAFGIPPAAAAVAYALLFGWVVGFAITFLRYKNFNVRRSGELLKIAGGEFTHREYAFSTRRINFLDIRQSLTSKFLKIYSLYIYSIGYGKYKDDIACLMPAENKKDFAANLKLLLWEMEPIPRQLAPAKGGILRFLALPLALGIGIPAVMGLARLLFPDWWEFVLFLGLMGLVPVLYFFIIRVMDYRTGGLAFDGENYTIRYSAGMYLHTVVIPARRVILIENRQSLMQRRKDRCDCHIFTVAEGRMCHILRGLDRKKAEEFLNKSYNIYKSSK
ncbi:PH domain-containing protein [Oscillospiraceae bacterium MB08-C2-2]|nr:PH domain-containing protein [Oscillospiraceae bacterium MB08-C2-2]